MEKQQGWPEQFDILPGTNIVRGLVRAVKWAVTPISDAPLHRSNHYYPEHFADTGAEAMLAAELDVPENIELGNE